MKPKIIIALVFAVSSFIFVARSTYYAGFRAGVYERRTAQQNNISIPVPLAQKRKYSSQVVRLHLGSISDLPLESVPPLAQALAQNRKSAVFVADFHLVGPAYYDYRITYNRWENSLDYAEWVNGQNEYSAVHVLFKGVTDAILQKAAAKELTFARLAELGCQKILVRGPAKFAASGK